MKKLYGLLAVSLVAVMMIPAARADIASTEYVNSKDTDIRNDMEAKANKATDNYTSGSTIEYPSIKVAEDIAKIAAGAAVGDYALKTELEEEADARGQADTAIKADIQKNAAEIATNTENIAKKQDALTETQLKAVNSGITADKVSTYNTAVTTANNALPKATYESQVGTVSATNMGTTAATVVGAIKEIKSAVSATDGATVKTDQGTTNKDKAVITDSKGKVTTGQIATGMVADGAVSTEKIATGAVTSAKIADGAIVNANISDSAAIAQSKISGLTDALAGKQDNLSTKQMNAVNSGITADKVTMYDDYDAKITAAKNQADKGVADAAAAQTTANAAVVANKAITAGTGTKITYDTKGLVTGSTSLAASDIPTLTTGKISGLDDALAAKFVAPGTSATSTDGTYTLTMKVVNNQPTYAWEKIGRGE